MPHVFISYVRENGRVVDKLCAELAAAGIEVWRDRDRIMPGERWQIAIRYAIQQGAYFVACFSRESAEKSRTYMNEELTVAIDELRRRPTERRWFIPVLLDPDTVPRRQISNGESIADLQWVDLSENWSVGVGRLIDAIRPGMHTRRSRSRRALLTMIGLAFLAMLIAFYVSWLTRGTRSDVSNPSEQRSTLASVVTTRSDVVPSEVARVSNATAPPATTSQHDIGPVGRNVNQFRDVTLTIEMCEQHNTTVQCRLKVEATETQAAFKIVLSRSFLYDDAAHRYSAVADAVALQVQIRPREVAFTEVAFSVPRRAHVVAVVLAAEGDDNQNASLAFYKIPLEGEAVGGTA